MRHLRGLTFGIESQEAAPVTETGFTGRHLVLLREDAVEEGIGVLTESADLSTTSTADTDSGVLELEQVREADVVVFDQLGVALVDAAPDQLQSVAAQSTEESSILAIEPERVVYPVEEAMSGLGASPALGLSSEYLRGYRDAAAALLGTLAPAGAPGLASSVAPVALAFEETQTTWGLQAVRADCSSFSGRGTSVAVLDTGMDLNHPDFAGRNIQSRSFVSGEAVQDLHGHGTHCIGTACGPLQPKTRPRYGVAHEAEIFAGKVLSNQGRGGDSGILAGMNWALRNGCHVISMSLGAPVRKGQPFSAVFENAARRILSRGTVVIAAAGNDSERASGIFQPVSHPANCPSIMAVAAIDSAFAVADFSNQGINLQGGQVDVAAPGVDVRSSWPSPTVHKTISGTSMATPHVAGIAALLAEANNARGAQLQQLIIESCRALALPSADMGAGLVQAP